MNRFIKPNRMGVHEFSEQLETLSGQPLSVRIYGWLRTEAVGSFDQFLAFTPEEMQKAPNCGKKTIEHIVALQAKVRERRQQTAS